MWRTGTATAACCFNHYFTRCRFLKLRLYRNFSKNHSFVKRRERRGANALLFTRRHLAMSAHKTRARSWCTVKVATIMEKMFATRRMVSRACAKGSAVNTHARFDVYIVV